MFTIEFRSQIFEVRAMPAAFPDPARATPQGWYEQMIRFHWNQSKTLTSRLADKKLGLQQWADDFHQTILEAHANAHWIGRRVVGAGKDELTFADVLAGRNRADIDAEYLQGFIDDIASGRYTDPETGELLLNQIYNRQRLYLGKVRGTAGQATVDNLSKDTEVYWRLGGAEEHCEECPSLAAISPFFKDDLFTTPGAGDTPCLGNCKCHLHFEYGDKELTTIQPVELEL